MSDAAIEGGAVQQPRPPAPLTPPNLAVWASSPVGRHSPLVIAAGPVLELCAALRTGSRGTNVEHLHREAFRTIRQFEERAGLLGMAPKMLKASKYALCATLDDVAMNSPWGSRSIWTSRSLVGAHFSETWGGDRFFDLLDQVRKDPGVNIDLIELLYCCLSLGFQGRLRISARGAGELQLLREDLYRLIRSIRGNSERDLSPHWRGTLVPSVEGGAWLPVWATALIGAGAVVGLYLLLALLLNGPLRAIADLVAGLPPRGDVVIVREAPGPAVLVLSADRLRGFLEPEIREGLVSVSEDDRAITVIVRGDGMFASAKAVPLPQFMNLLQRVGRALEAETGPGLITGHTDSQGINSAEFPSNQALSLARAEAVARIIRLELSDPERIAVEGRGASQPIAPNDTADGRGLNRRTEIILFKDAG